MDGVSGGVKAAAQKQAPSPPGNLVPAAALQPPSKPGATAPAAAAQPSRGLVPPQQNQMQLMVATC